MAELRHDVLLFWGAATHGRQGPGWIIHMPTSQDTIVECALPRSMAGTMPGAVLSGGWGGGAEGGGGRDEGERRTLVVRCMSGWSGRIERWDRGFVHLYIVHVYWAYRAKLYGLYLQHCYFTRPHGFLTGENPPPPGPMDLRGKNLSRPWPVWVGPRPVREISIPTTQLLIGAKMVFAHRLTERNACRLWYHFFFTNWLIQSYFLRLIVHRKPSNNSFSLAKLRFSLIRNAKTLSPRLFRATF